MMKRASEQTRRRIVLVGGGHAHVGVVKSLAMMPVPGVEVVLIAKELDAPYSGMLPGFVAGHYQLDECHIDLVRLAHFAGARLIHGEAVGIDRATRRVAIAGRPPIAYDLLSIDTGITPLLDGIEGADEHAIAVKPVSTFAPRWEALLARALEPDGPRRIAVVGTGAAGFEIVLAVRHRLLKEAPARRIDPAAFSFSLVGSSDVLPTHNGRARRLALAELQRQGVRLVTGEAVTAIGCQSLTLASGRTLDSDATLLTTRAAPPAWFRDTGLALDERGFLAVRATLQVLDDDDVFAVGDCATVLEHRREKAGVFAVRQAGPLARNLRLRHEGRAAEPFVPQRAFLTLLALGDKRAIAARGPFAAAGGWAWRWKDRIDREFMTAFQDLPTIEPGSEDGQDLACAGCAAKLGPVALAGALDRLPSAPAGLAVRDLAPRRDDAALLDLGPGPLRLETIDQFPAIWPDPFVLGEIAAAHALGDIVAKGGRPDHALALATLPPAVPRLAEDDLEQLLAGMRRVLDAEGVALVGGHTSRGMELGAGLFVSGTVERERHLAKGGLSAGDALVLTKPIGTGILFAGWMRGLARAREIAAALATMRQTSSEAARILSRHGATAMTDITGFGLAGHLIEMLKASGMAATVGLGSVARLDGAGRLVAAGVRSSLLPENLGRASLVDVAGDREAALALLFDPQTSGGLVAGVPELRAGACVAALGAAGVDARVIGRVTGKPAPGAGLLRVEEEAAAPAAAATAAGDHVAIKST